MLQLLGDSVGALSLDPNRGLCPPDPLTHFAVPQKYFPKVYAYAAKPLSERLQVVQVALLMLSISIRPEF